MISSPGLGSGLDVNSIVSQLLAIERLPLDRLEARRNQFETQISALGRLKSAVSTFQSAMDSLNSPSDFKIFSAQSSDEAVLTASASETAASGSYSLDVDRIAEQHKQAAGTTYVDADTDIGATGNATIDVGGNSFDVDIAGKSLAQIRDTINSDENNTGVTASIINDDAGSRLLLTSDETGSDGFMSVSFSDYTAGVDDPFAFSDLNTDRDGAGGFTAADLDAQITLEGQFTITSSSNTLTDVIDGLTLNLESAGSTTLNVSKDTEKVTESVQSFLDAYNELTSTIDSLRLGDLSGDSTLLGIEQQLQDVFNTPPSGIASQYSYLSEIGITTGADGKLTLDSTELGTALDTDFDGVAELFAHDDQGYAFRLEDVADNILGVGGLIESREDGINNNIDGLDSRISLQERRLDLVEDRLRAEFTALDLLLTQISSTGQYLSATLAGLPGAG